MVRVHAHGGTTQAVSAGRRRYVYSDGRAPIDDAMLPNERVRLGEIRGHREDWLGR
jgi:hypothetical protein